MTPQRISKKLERVMGIEPIRVAPYTQTDQSVTRGVGSTCDLRVTAREPSLPQEFRPDSGRCKPAIDPF